MNKVQGQNKTWVQWALGAVLAALLLALLPAVAFGAEEDASADISIQADITTQATLTSIANAEIHWENGSDPVEYTGNTAPKNFELYVQVNGESKKLVKGRDYNFSLENGVGPGTATYVCAGIESAGFTGIIRASYQIKVQLAHASILGLSSQAYAYKGGNPVTPAVIVKMGDYTVPASSYIVTYKNNTSPGTATVTVSAVTGGVCQEGTFGVRTFTIAASGGISDGTGSSSSTNITASAANTANTAPAVGGTWRKSGGKWWFSYNSSTAAAQKKAYPTSQWVRIGTGRYFFDSAGWMRTGWLQQGDNWYYLGSDGAMKTKWQKSGGKWYYLNSNGVMQRGELKIGNTRYYLNDNSGAMVTGWHDEGKSVQGVNWRHYGSSGAMTTGWLQSGG